MLPKIILNPESHISIKYVKNNYLISIYIYFFQFNFTFFKECVHRPIKISYLSASSFSMQNRFIE